jgi:hypothetical protein
MPFMLLTDARLAYNNAVHFDSPIQCDVIYSVNGGDLGDEASRYFGLCVHLDVHEKRCDRDDLFELVFFQKDFLEWERILSAFLENPVKPSGKSPTPKDLAVTEGTGSIRVEQTLFEKSVENG